MVGDEVSVENLLKGIIIASGNDACIALAEGIAGTEEEFAIMMTLKQKKLVWKIQILQIHQELMILIIIQLLEI
jgi:D-alanyl-D-alanine carboxypeptidase